jgi:hypothetical protein
MRVVAVTTTHASEALGEADVIAASLLDIQIAASSRASGPNGELLEVTIHV